MSCIVATTAGVACLAVCSSVRYWILRPRTRARGWASASVALASARGTLVALAVWLALRQTSYPAPAALAEALVAGLQSALVQLSPVNQRYIQFLGEASNERRRFLRWALLEALYFANVKSAGALAGGGQQGLSELIALCPRVLVLASAQYPWMAAIARCRTGSPTFARTPSTLGIDLQTMALSAVCVALSALNGVGARGAPLLSLLLGLAGLLVYRAAARQRRPPQEARRFAPPTSR